MWGFGVDWQVEAKPEKIKKIKKICELWLWATRQLPWRKSHGYSLLEFLYLPKVEDIFNL